MRIRPIALLVALVALPVALAGQAPPGDSTPLGKDPQVITGVLSNGLHYYIRENHRPEQRAELRLAVNAGMVTEDDDQLGLAHFTEHMAFNGTTHFPKNDLIAYMRSIGMRFGPEVNAYTRFDETVYTLTVPTDTAALFEKGLQVLDDWAEGQVFDTAEVRKERGVILEELRLHRGAEGRILDKELPVVFAGSRYADRNPGSLASMASIQQFDPKALVRFYRDWYRPDEMAVVVVGDVDARKVEAEVRVRFGAIPTPPSPRPHPFYTVPPSDTARYLSITDPEFPMSQVGAYWRVPADTAHTVGDYRRQLVERLHDAMLGQRLNELAQKPDPPFVAAGAGHGALVRPERMYMISAAAREGEQARALAAILTEAERARQHGYTAGELDRAKADLLRNYEQAFAERDKTESANYAREYVANFLEDEPYPGIAAEYALVRQLLPTITLADVNALSGRLLAGKSRGVLAIAPEKTGLTPITTTRLAAVFDSVQQTSVAAYRDEVAAAPLVADLPAPARIVSERALPQVDARELRLANGVRVILKSTDFKADEVLLTGYAPGGASLVSDRDASLAGLVPAVVMNGGLGAFSAVDLQKKLAGKRAQVGVSLNETTANVSGSASPRDLETLFQLLYLRLTAPRADTAAFQAMRQRLHAFLDNRGAEPEAVFSDSVSVALSQHSARRRPVTSALVDSLSLDDALRIYRDRIGNAGGFTFVLVGAFNPDSIRPLVVKYLGALPAAPRQRWRDVNPETPAGIVKVTVHKGIEPKSQVVIYFSGPAATAPDDRHSLAALSEMLSIRLIDVVREELGGTYGIGAGGSSERWPRPRFRLQIGFGCAPDRVDELTARVFKEVEQLRTAGPDSALVEKVVQQERRGLETALKTNGWWLNRLSAATYMGEEFGGAAWASALIDRVNARSLQAAARQYLNPDRYVQGVLLPESPKPEVKAVPQK